MAYGSGEPAFDATLVFGGGAYLSAGRLVRRGETAFLQHPSARSPRPWRRS